MDFGRHKLSISLSLFTLSVQMGHGIMYFHKEKGEGTAKKKYTKKNTPIFNRSKIFSCLTICIIVPWQRK